MDALTALAARCEAADASEQRELLELAWQLIHGDPKHDLDWGTAAETSDFLCKLKSEAFVDAAIMLLPEGWEWTVSNYYDGAVATAAPTGSLNAFAVDASTPALALAAAALKARA